LLELLRIQDKVTIKDGEFSTTKLSTGQKKRLALLVSYLEDRPICLFDEWAADQDPEYRKFFYY
jgi:putative ATP-binding cassette transporter